MPDTITFLHTSPVHVKTFNTLVDKLSFDIPIKHIVDESLLQEAIDQGQITPALAQRIGDTIRSAEAEGAKVILCTCSTIGDCAENTANLNHNTVIRVDRPMAEKAVAIGTRIIVAATLQSTIEPTISLILDSAAKVGKEVELVALLCELAWAKFEQGDQDGYIEDIATDLRQVASQGDVIVLAQASMAGAANLCSDLPVPILSSPSLGLKAAIAAYQNTSYTHRKSN